MGHKQGGRVGAEIILYMTHDVVPLEYRYSLLISVLYIIFYIYYIFIAAKCYRFIQITLLIMF